MFRKQNLIKGVLFGLLALTTFIVAVQPAMATPINPLLGEESVVNRPALGWLSSWGFRRTVTISNTLGALTNYQVRVALDNTFIWSKAKSNGSDVRFTSSDGTTNIPFWIECWNSSASGCASSANIWVQVPSIAANATTTIYFYYGNPSATSASNGPNTFILFDNEWAPTLNPVQTAKQSWWEVDVTYPMVFTDTNPSLAHPGYQMLYDGHHNLTYGESKGYAYSPDLISWTEYDSGLSHPPTPNAIMGPAGYPGSANFAWGDTIKVGSTYHMFTVQAPTTAPTAVHAQSTDLIHWTSTTGITATFDSLTTNDPVPIGTGVAILKEADGITPVVVDNKYWMVYFHGGNTQRMFLAYADATTPSGLLTWTTNLDGGGLAIPYLSAGPSTWEADGIHTPSFVRVNTKYYLYYQGDQINVGWKLGFASTNAYSGGNPVRPDNVVWTRSPNNPVVNATHGWDGNGAIDPILRYFNGKYYLFYTGINPQNVWTNGFATSTSPEGPWADLCPSDGCGPNWDIIGNPTVSNGIMSFASGQAVRSFPLTYSSGNALGFRARFLQNQNTGIYKWAGFITATSAPYLLIDSIGPNLLLTASNATTPDVNLNSYYGAFQNYEIAWLSLEGRAYINHSPTPVGSVTLGSSLGSLPAQFRNSNDGANKLDVDWVYLRQFSDPEPTVALGSETPTAVTLSSFNAHADDSFTNVLLVVGLAAIAGVVTFAGLRSRFFRK